MNIGNGIHTWVWEDKWVPRIEDFQVVSSRPINAQPYRVSDLIARNNGIWKMGLLRNLFTP